METSDQTTVEQLDTPSLLLDLDVMEQNLKEIAQFAKQQGIRWRPHIKTHKCVEIARKQLAYGACGITVAKVSEAEVMAKAGIRDILIAYPLSSPLKLQRVAALLPLAKLTLAVDHAKQAELLDQFFAHTSAVVDVWIKVDSGLHRCGVEPGAETVALAKEIAKYPHLRLQGLFTHAGHSYAASSREEIERIGEYEGQAVAESAAWCEQEGIPIPHRSVGSTPTFRISGRQPGITEVRPGNAVFYDAIQVGLGVATYEQCALRVLSSVVSMRPHERLVLDAGSKTLSLDQGAHGNATVKGFGHIVGHPELTIQRLSEEHGVVAIDRATNLALTDRVQIIPNHACTVVNLFDRYVLHRKGVIVGEWRIEARGKVQ
ncbi:D-TA family PLP-dependent enzyme [Brevibacillus marinus]|uniref:D-TA family PLP-dependent enzyme n=1 Tax=Brevibacillus marinus TaxID=2496837 RepID=UPI000F81DBB9|nr:D-TA family PLP-dependent enzyme [Brevibacillus marinus]